MRKIVHYTLDLDGGNSGDERSSLKGIKIQLVSSCIPMVFVNCSYNCIV